MSRLEPRAPHARRLVNAALVAATLVVAAIQSGLELGTLWSAAGAAAAWDALAELAQPDLGGDSLHRMAGLALESVWIGALGTLLALILGVAMAVAAAALPGLAFAPASRPWARAGARLGRGLARACLSFLRSVPEIVWAYLFVRIVGLGPGAAVLAIGLSCGGIIGKLYAELIEAVDPAPARQLAAAGAGRVAIFVYGVFPLLRAQWIGYGLFRFECAIRSAAVLGVVGAGGLGQEMALSIRYYQLDKLATALLAVLALMLVLEAVSAMLRRRSAGTSVAFIAALGLLGMLALSVPWADLASPAALRELGRFAAGFASPTLARGFLVHALELTWVTVAMAWVATCLAAAAALVLTPVAVRAGVALHDPPGARGLRVLAAHALMIMFRLVLQVARALPELVWALLFILWLGPGVTAGTLAVAVHTVGILGRLYSDTLEEAEPEPMRMLESAGASRLGVLLYGALPQIAPRLLSYTLYRFEVNIRATATVGFVGAGGLGDALHTALSLFHMRDLATLMAVLFATVLVVDHLGSRLRARILARRR